ncbi:MAG: restriction endonuclease subunit S [Cyanobacteria bacterium SID2]|nr:restriction endonuclease subunit S [Cyanobacteria bacterium SID2]
MIQRKEKIDTLTHKVNTWNPKKIKDIFEFKYIDIASVDRDSKEITDSQSILTSDAPSRARQLIQDGDVLVSTVRPNLNAVAYVTSQDEGATASTGFTVLRADKKNLDPRYLYYWVRTPYFVDDMTRKSTGANYPAVSDSIIKNSKIPLPPIAEQKRIAEILDKADAVRRKRQEAIRLTEELLRSTFLEMFGDPVTNPKGWDVAQIRQLGKVITGNTPPRSDPSNYGDGIEWIKSDNITVPNHFLTEASERLSSQGKKIARIAPKNSVLVTCIAGSKSSIGRAGIADREVAFNQQINAIIPNPNVSYYFLYSQILVAQNLVQQKSTNSMKGMVNKKKFSEILLLNPPFEIQQKFSDIFIRIMSLTKKTNSNLTESENLFNSLLQRAFRGEL